MLPYRSIFVTGSSGFVGRRFVEALRAVVLPDTRIRSGSTHPDDGDPVFDLLDRESVARAIDRARPDLVVHLAAQSSVGQAQSEAAGTWRTNVCGTLALAEAVADFTPTATVLFTSSAEIYGAAFNQGMVDENSVPAPKSPYARSKRCAEELLADTLTPTNRLIVMRPTNHSGAGQDTRFVLPAFADQVAAIEANRIPPVLRVGSLAAKRDFLDVEDVIQAYLAVLSTPNSEMRTTFNVASGVVISIGGLLNLLLAASPVEVSVEPDPTRMRASDVPVTAIDATRLRKATGWAPSRSIESMVKAVLEDRRRHHR